jgi:NTE family protein
MRANDKVALVLAGGGLAGAVYEIGALRAIDDLLVDRTVNDLDMYVGTSAGAFVGAAMANGLSPEDLLRIIDGTDLGIHPVERRDLFRLNGGEFLRKGLGLPRTMWRAASHYLRHLDDMHPFDILWSLTEALPSGLYDGLALERYVREALLASGRSNDFRTVPRDLYIVATELDTGERAVFCRDRGEVPISLAVAASSAVPLLYKPVRIGNREYVDGGMRGNASLDLAIEEGAGLVICINPLVPYDNSSRQCIPFLGPDGGYLSEKGVSAIASQATRITTNSGLHYHVKQLRRRFPQTDIILIEPRPDDYQMAFHNIMRYSTRLTVARHGFESVTMDLAESYGHYRKILARHGIPLTRRIVVSELARIQQSGYDPEVVRSILESRPATCARARRGTPVCELTRSLAELDLVLHQMGADT